MDFAYSERCESFRSRVQAFMDTHIVPRLPQARQETENGAYPLSFREELKAKAKAQGLWNLFLPGLHADEPGTPLSNLDYAPVAEIMGRIEWASEVFNCNAPDTGNMELLHMFATPEQSERWLKPLLNGEFRSAFAMTEPAVASSDATNIQTSIRRQGNEYVINGRKWFITNLARPNCKLIIVMGKTDPDAPSHKQQSMVLVPRDAKGVEVVRNVTTLNHHSPIGHCEVVFRDVRVPVENLLGDEGGGFRMAQARLGPGRIHHCMRAIGQARLLVLKTASLIDQVGAAGARKEISMIKALVPSMLTTVADRAIQAFGAMGISPDTPLANIYTDGRSLRFADGPDEVHLRVIGRAELGQSNERRASLQQYLAA